MDIKKISIDSIGLSARANHCLHEVGVKTVEDMLGYTEETLSKIRSMGRKSIDEVLQKIEEYKNYQPGDILSDTEEQADIYIPDVLEDFGTFADADEGKAFIRSWLKQSGSNISDLELLSPKAYNLLMLNGNTDLSSVVFMTEAELMQIPRMDIQSADEIIKRCRQFLEEKQGGIIAFLKEKRSVAEQGKISALRRMLHDDHNHESIYQYVKVNDIEISMLPFSNRSKNMFIRRKCKYLSDIIFMTIQEIQDFPSIGKKSADEIINFINDYLVRHEARIKAVINGDDSMLWSDESIIDNILNTYNELGFGGLSLLEMREKVGISDQISDERLKKIIGGLLAEGKLEYVDFRCYRVYPKYIDYVKACRQINERSREILCRRLQGETLEAIASDYDLTRERVRQIVKKSVKTVRNCFATDTGMQWFDEDYYRYFYSTYSFDKKDGEEWLGLDRYIINYMEMMGVARGNRSLEEAVDDNRNLDHGLRLKIKNYLNRNKLYLDGRWIEKTRANLEEYVAQKFCRDSVSFESFIDLYNNFLKGEEIPYDENIYITEDIRRTRENRLSEARFILWKYNRQIRYYDIDGQDFTELLDTLNLDAYENIEYSTMKFICDFPEIMDKYDIRDHYELHNLLRKIVKDGDYHDFHCERTPNIRFGTFDRTGALFDLMIDNAPISQVDLAEIICQEYGHDTATIIGTYLAPLAPYYHQGMYTIDQKAMSAVNQKALMDQLTKDFYYIDEIRKLFAKIAPNADIEEINPYNLKNMGFTVLSNYVFRNYSSLEALYRDDLTREDITDITPYRRRYAYVMTFSKTFVEMKRKLEIFEFEPNQIITFRKLAEAGVTREELLAFCDEVYDFVADENYFSIQSIKQEGFDSELFDLGFSDWFYSSLLTVDERFTNSHMFSNIILYKGNERITIKSFEMRLIQEYGSIDVYDLQDEMEEKYGCRIQDRWDIIYKVAGTAVHYDKYTDRLYANNEIFNRELDAAEGM